MNGDRLTLEKLQDVCRKFDVIKQAGYREGRAVFEFA